jgi:hypothetical protein
MIFTVVSMKNVVFWGALVRTDSTHHVKSSIELVHVLRSLQVDTRDVTVSFDIVYYCLLGCQ